MRFSAIIFYSFLYSLNSNALSLELGGILCRLPKSIGYECGVTATARAYYFDSDVGECIQFLFLGCGGNQNRFSTKEDCEEGCASMTKCGKGLPLMDFAGNIKRCDTSNMPCPLDYECIGRGLKSVCCKKVDRVCNLAVDTGTLCGVALTTRYYFDESSNVCRPFSYAGCGGNENNFKSKGQCIRYCAKTVTCLRGDPLPDRYLSTRLMSCSSRSECPINYTCTGKTPNKACCPSKEYVCGTPYESQTPCRDQLERNLWTFNAKEGLCEMIELPACANQLNTFASSDQCAEFCIGACPGNLQPHLNPLTALPQLCNPKKKYGCPLGFECLKSTEFASVCCKTQPICPAAESLAEANSDGSGPRRCDPDVLQGCSDGYECQQANNMEHICCTPALDCPYGMKALREQFGRPHVCSKGVQGGCPGNFICVRGNSRMQRHLCCQPEKKCVLPYVSEHNKKPKKCFPGESVCPDSTDCLAVLNDLEKEFNVLDISFYCCHRVDIFTCSNGAMPSLNERTNSPERCNPSDPNACSGEDKICERLIDGSYSCCPNPFIKNRPCNEAALDSERQPIRCKGWADNNCIEGACRKAVDGQYYCCKS